MTTNWRRVSMCQCLRRIWIRGIWNSKTKHYIMSYICRRLDWYIPKSFPSRTLSELLICFANYRCVDDICTFILLFCDLIPSIKTECAVNRNNLKLIVSPSSQKEYFLPSLELFQFKRSLSEFAFIHQILVFIYLHRFVCINVFIVF